MKRYEPRSLHLKGLLPQEEREYLDGYGYVVSHLYQVRFADNRWKELKTLGKMARKRFYTPLNSVLLRRILGTRHAKRIVDNLCTLGVIETDNQYVPHSKSRSYRLCLQYANSKYRGFDYTPQFSKRLGTILKAEREKQLTKTQREIAAQIAQNFHVDTKRAHLILSHLDLDALTENRMKLMLDRIAHLDLGHSASHQTGRYFNLLMNLKRELRKAIVGNLRGSLVEVDIANSQPFFFAVLLRGVAQNNIEIMRIVEVVGFDASEMRRVVRNRRFGKFAKLTASGTFYRYIHEHSKLPLNEVKTETLKTFFKSLKYTTPFEQRFGRLFPSVLEVMMAIKAMKGYNRFAILLQRIESYVVIEQLCEGLLWEEIPFIPIHDSVVVHAKYADEVKWIVESLCRGIGGMQPLVRVKAVGG